MKYTRERLNKILSENAFKEYEFFMLCAGKRKSEIDKEKKDFIKDICEKYNSIDEEMIPILIELNEKGYMTDFSCSGHLEEIEKDGRYNVYLVFHNLYNIDIKEIPFLENCKIEGRIINWYGNKNGTIEEKENDRKRLMKELLEWTKKLDKCNSKDYYIKDGWIYLGNEKSFQYNE